MLHLFPPELLLHSVQYLSDLNDVFALKSTCQYIYVVISNNKSSIKATRTIKYNISRDNNIFIVKLILDINNTGSFSIKNNSENISAIVYRLTGSVVKGYIIYCEKKYINQCGSLWRVLYIDKKVDKLYYNRLCGADLITLSNYKDNYSDFDDSYNTINSLIRGNMPYICKFAKDRILRYIDSIFN